MCNRYRIRATEAELEEYFEATRGLLQHRPVLPRLLFPDGIAPIIRLGSNGKRELVEMRWGMPGPAVYGGRPVTNIRNTQSAHWRRWLAPPSRCLVPLTSFCEWENTSPKKTPVRFALNKDRPLAAFAGLWTTWTGARGTKAAPIEGEHLLYGFLTTEAIDVVRPIHEKAMPVILTSKEEQGMWLHAPWQEASALQKPLQSETLVVVSRGSAEDE